MKTFNNPLKGDPQIILLCLVFFISGMAAVLYQLIWQRALFTIFGTNVESVTIVVAAFMMGLGLGSLAGGRLAMALRGKLLLAFAFFEIGIGAFGFFSLTFFKWVGTVVLAASTFSVGVVTFACVLFPTLLMGATLPVLVEYVVARLRNVGQAVAILYFINTLGSGVACFLAGILLFKNLGESGAVLFAASLNFLAAILILLSIKINKPVRAEAGKDIT